MSDQQNNELNGAHLSPELRLQYLDAMGIQVWQSRYQTEAEVIPAPTEAIESAEVQTPVVEKSDAGVINPVVDESISDWSDIGAKVAACQACELHQNRRQTIVAEGNESAKIMFISTAPATDAESANSLLAKDSSELFTNMLKAIELNRTGIYFTTLVKCQLPEHGELRTTEVLCCEQFLSQQIEQVQPDLIVAMGEVSAQQLVVSKKSLPELRGKTYQYHSVPLMLMSHPDELLLAPENKRQAWHDLIQIKQKLNG